MQCDNINNNIEIIKGDSCEIGITLSNVDLDIIDKVYISNDKLGICKECSYNDEDECYDFILDPSETSELAVGYTDFDITVKFIDSNVLTPMYRANFIVKEKVNKVRCINNE